MSIHQRACLLKNRCNKSASQMLLIEDLNIDDVSKVNNQPIKQLQALIPQPFHTTLDDATFEVLTTTSRRQERPDGYVEQHVFRAVEPAYIIAQFNGRVGIVQGRVTECYTNVANITLYVIEVKSDTTMEYHMPRFLCFHYHEDAAFVLQHVISEEERNVIKEYSTPYASREVANGLQYHLAEEYSRMILNDTRPKTQLEQRSFPGPVALGLPSSRLVGVNSDEESETETNEQCREESSPKIQSKSGLDKRSRVCVLQQDANTSGELTKSSLITNQKEAVVAEQTLAPAYDSYFRRDFAMVNDRFHNITLLRRILESAKENVTWFAASRIPNNVEVNYNDLYGQVASVLDYYYEIRSRQRRYLTFSHFNVANETNQSGSTSRCFCSFCNKKFNDDEPLRYHYHKFHSIVEIYTCEMCEKQFTLPSLFRLHIFDCDATLGLSLILNVNLPMVDAFADYLGSRSINNAPMHVLRPGLPNFTRTAPKFKVQSSYMNVLADWPVHVRIDSALNELNDQASHVENSEPGPSSSPQRSEVSIKCGRSRVAKKPRASDGESSAHTGESEESELEEDQPRRSRRLAKAK